MPLLILTALSVFATYFVFKDARRRGMHASGWSLAILLSSMLALPVYLILRRPKQIS